jgi:hypothetical protein
LLILSETGGGAGAGVLNKEGGNQVRVQAGRDLTQRRRDAKTAKQSPFILCALAPLRLCVDFSSRRRMRRCSFWFIKISTGFTG